MALHPGRSRSLASPCFTKGEVYLHDASKLDNTNSATELTCKHKKHLQCKCFFSYICLRKAAFCAVTCRSLLFAVSGIFPINIQYREAVRASETSLGHQLRNGCRNKFAATRTGNTGHLCRRAARNRFKIFVRERIRIFFVVLIIHIYFPFL